MSRLPKPVEQKKRQGTYRKDRDPSHGNLAAVPAMKPELEELPVGECVDAVLAEGVVWLAATDAPTVALMREAIVDYNEARRRYDFRSATDLRKQIASLLAELGFSPASRTRLGLAEVKAAESTARLEQIRNSRR